MDTAKPITPSIRTPIAETLTTISNSFLEGFFSTSHTLFDFEKNALSSSNFLMVLINKGGF